MNIPDKFYERLTEKFVDHYHNVAAPWRFTQWMGHQVSKCPMDLWTYQEIIWETVPDLIIETGTGGGGSASFFASLFDLSNGRGEIVTIDTESYPDLQPRHKRIRYLIGDSTGDTLMHHLVNYHQPLHDKRIMVVLDSLHTYQHVMDELKLYAGLVTPGCYLVVEDTAVDGSAGWEGPAARQAVKDFVAVNPRFEIDKGREKHLLTLNPDGWVKRVA